MTHQMEISFDYGDTRSDEYVRPALDLLSGLSNIRDTAHRNLHARNARIPSQRRTNRDIKHPNRNNAQPRK